MAESKQSEGLLLLQNENIDEFNKWRMRNLTLKLAFDKIDFSKKTPFLEFSCSKTFDLKFFYFCSIVDLDTNR